MMKIILTENQIKKIIKEAVKIKKNHLDIYNKLVNKWRSEMISLDLNKDYIKKFFGDEQEDPNNLIVPDSEKIFIKHLNMLSSGNLNEDNEAVKAFLHRHDGNTIGTRKITLDQLKNINFLKLSELVEFLNFTDEFNIQFVKNIENEDDDPEIKEQQRLDIIFSDNDVTPAKVKESKKLWFNESKAKIVEGPVRVYEIMNQSDAIRFGYYYQKTSLDAIKAAGLEHSKYPWCITHRKKDSRFYYIDDEGNEYAQFPRNQMTNQYSHYRNQGYTFYFLIDDSKNPLDQYYIVSIAVNKNGIILYTNQFNSINDYYTWTKVVSLHPQLAEHRDKFIYREKDTKPLEVVSFKDRYSEISGNANEYSRQSIDIKKRYIDDMGNLTKPISWVTTPIELRKNYIKNTTKENLFERFSNMAFIMEVMRKTTDKNYFIYVLENDIKYVDGYKGFIQKMMLSECQVWFENKNNKEISVLRNRNNGEIGIFDYDKSMWLELNGVKYTDDYKLIGNRPQIYFVNNKQMLVYQYGKNNIVDSNTFYVLVTLEDNRKKPIPGLIFSQSVFNKLENEKKLKRKGKGMPYETNFDFETGSDIKENLKKKLLSFQ